MSKIEITSATLKGRYSLDYSYSEVLDKESNNIKVSSDAAVHPDLRNSFAELVPHLALICEEVKEKEVKKLIENGIPEIKEDESPDPVLIKYQVNSFRMTPNGGSVELIGVKILEIGESISLKSPRIKLTDSKYKFVSELSQTIEQCKVEVNEYLNGKHDPNKQVDMFKELEVIVEEERVEL